MVYCDAHFHLVPYMDAAGLDECNVAGAGGPSSLFPELFCTCAHDRTEFERQEKLLSGWGIDGAVCAFGIHPQNPDLDNIDFLESLAESGRIGAIGETGFDFFTAELKSDKERQKRAFEASCRIAACHQVPLVVHDRKALDVLFEYSSMLRKVPAVLFHSFAFTSREARSLLDRGINGWFSFSKQVLNGNRKVLSCIQDLDMDRIIPETDGPFQTLKGESLTHPVEVRRIYEEICRVRSMDLEELCGRAEENFRILFGL